MEDVSTTTAILVNLIENWNIAWDTKSFRGLVITVQRSRYSFLPVGCSVMLQSLSNRLFVSLWLLWLPTGFLLLLIPHRCLLMVSHAAMLLYGLCSCSKLLTHFPSLPHIYPLPDKGIVSTGLVTLWPLKTALSSQQAQTCCFGHTPTPDSSGLGQGGGVTPEGHADWSKHSERNSNMPSFTVTCD